MKAKILRTTVTAVVLTSMLILAACGSNGNSDNYATSNSSDASPSSSVSSAPKEPVEITLLDSSDKTTDLGKHTYDIYKQFQDKYTGEIVLNIESTPNLDALIEKVKLLYATGDAPDLFNASGYDITSLGITSDKVADMQPYLNADPEFKSWVSQANIDFNTKEGKLNSISPTVAAMGMWYNKELFQKAGITPAKTWDEFWSNAEKLKEAGITPMSLDTRDQAWITNLLLGAMIGSGSEAGNTFMSQFHPKDFNTPEVIDALTKIQKAFVEYAPKNASGADYNAAANSFLTGKTAMIFNGPWMAGDIADKTKAPEGFSDKVGASLYPDDSAYVSGTPGFIVGNNGKDKVDAAMKFVKFMQSPDIQVDMAITGGNYPDNPLITFTEEQKAKAPLFIETINLINNAKTIIKQNYQSAWYKNVSDEFTVLYPQLIFNKITPEDFAKKLTAVAQKNQ